MIVKEPLSENKRKRNTATLDECVADLILISQSLLDQPSITRAYYRKFGKFSEAAWIKHFGTFQEFKCQAGLHLRRHARKMGLDIAKHASLNAYEEMNVQKRDWSEKYKKPTGKRFETILVGSDVHDIECDPFWRTTFIDTARRAQPDKIVINGDLFDLPEFGKYEVDPREFNVVGRIKWVHKFLGDLREAAPDAELILIEGNHEYRLLRHLSEATPAMKVLLSDLHGMTVPKLLGLDQFEVNYVAPADLATFTKSDIHAEIGRNHLVMHDFLLFHHFPEGRSFGLPGVNGHHHKHLVDSFYSPIFGSYEWHQLGCGHKREATYTNGEKWNMGFALIHVDTEFKRAQFEYIDVTHKHVVIGGKWYVR